MREWRKTELRLDEYKNSIGSTDTKNLVNGGRMESSKMNTKDASRGERIEGFSEVGRM